MFQCFLAYWVVHLNVLYTNVIFLLSASAEEMMVEPEDSSEPMEAAFTLDQTAGGEFLSLDELGKLLSLLASQGQACLLKATSERALLLVFVRVINQRMTTMNVAYAEKIISFGAIKIRVFNFLKYCMGVTDIG